jgi:hypothetical protein
VGKTGQRKVDSDGEDEGSRDEEGSNNSEDNKIAQGGTSFVDNNDEEEVDEDPVGNMLLERVDT